MIKEGIQKVAAGIDLSEAEMIGAMNEIMEGAATPAQVGAFLTALSKRKGGRPSKPIRGTV